MASGVVHFNPKMHSHDWQLSCKFRGSFQLDLCHPAICMLTRHLCLHLCTSMFKKISIGLCISKQLLVYSFVWVFQSDTVLSPELCCRKGIQILAFDGSVHGTIWHNLNKQLKGQICHFHHFLSFEELMIQHFQSSQCRLDLSKFFLSGLMVGKIKVIVHRGVSVIHNLFSLFCFLFPFHSTHFLCGIHVDTDLSQNSGAGGMTKTLYLSQY